MIRWGWSSLDDTVTHRYELVVDGEGWLKGRRSLFHALSWIAVSIPITVGLYPFLYIQALMYGDIEALIFDLDGTMVDNMMIHHQAWHELLASVGIQMSLQEVMTKVHGVNVEILERLFGDRFTASEREDLSWRKEENYRRLYAKEMKLIDGLDLFLEQASQKGLPLAVASAAPPENVDFVLNNLGIQHLFSSIMHSQDVIHGKPHPEVFTKSADKLQIPIANCLIFEDSLVGAEAASRAGARMVLVTTTHEAKDFNSYDHIIAYIPNFLDFSLE